MRQEFDYMDAPAEASASLFTIVHSSLFSVEQPLKLFSIQGLGVYHNEENMKK